MCCRVFASNGPCSPAVTVIVLGLKAKFSMLTSTMAARGGRPKREQSENDGKAIRTRRSEVNLIS